MGFKDLLNKNIIISRGQANNFSLRRHFTLYSIAFFLLMTTLLGVVFISHEKKLLIDYSVYTAEEFARQINSHVSDDNVAAYIDEQSGREFKYSSPEYVKIDKMVNVYLNEFSDIFEINIIDANGRTMYSSARDSIGVINNSEELQAALSGQITSYLRKGERPQPGHSSEVGIADKIDVLEIYIPIYANKKDLHAKGEIVGAFEVYKDVSTVFNSARKGGYTIFILFAILMSILFWVWLIILKTADSIIRSKNEEINKYNRELEEAQYRISESIDEVIEHESFHVRYANRSLAKCWEVKSCELKDCPSYKSDSLRCWQVAGTFCGGEVQGVFAKKYGDCRKCEVYNKAFNNKINTIGESFNNMMSLLQSKHLELKEANKKLNVLIDVDPLTQIANRRSFQKRIESVHLMTLRYNHPYSVIICDVDNFKLYNDTYGHQQGDYVLISVANTMKTSIRRTDEIFRWGGEEFIVILPEQNHSDALKVAENLRRSVYDLAITHRKSEIQAVSISCGVSSFYPWKTRDISWEYVVRQADDALYKAKLGKKNCVYSASIT
jgi:diguanylate cyclase (GGDEF)-like protein